MHGLPPTTIMPCHAMPSHAVPSHANTCCQDWSVDGTVLQSNDASSEIIWWNADTGRQIRSSVDTVEADTVWDTWTCHLGFQVMGIWWVWCSGRCSGCERCGCSGCGRCGVVGGCDGCDGRIRIRILLVQTPACCDASASASGDPVAGCWSSESHKNVQSDRLFCPQHAHTCTNARTHARILHMYPVPFTLSTH